MQIFAKSLSAHSHFFLFAELSLFSCCLCDPHGRCWLCFFKQHVLYCKALAASEHHITVPLCTCSYLDTLITLCELLVECEQREQAATLLNSLQDRDSSAVSVLQGGG